MLIVKKFGGTSVADKERIFNVAKRCIEDYEKGNDVVVVLSAMGKYTDELIEKAHDINPNPPKREMDMLFTIGEQMSVSLMAMAMAQLGVRAVSLLSLIHIFQGKMPISVREKYLSMKTKENTKMINAMLRNFDMAMLHPDTQDLEGAKAFVKKVFEDIRKEELQYE